MITGHVSLLSGRRRLLASGLAVLACLTPILLAPGPEAMATPVAAASPIEFESVGEAPVEVAPIVEESRAGAVRSRFAVVDSGRLLAGLSAADVEIELFDDVVVDFGGTGQMSSGDDGQPTWSATTDDAVATLSFSDDGVRGTVSVGGTAYSLLPASATTHLIFEEGRDLPDESEAIAPPVVSTSDEPGSSPSAPADVATSAAGDPATPVVRVLTVYDDYSRTYYGGDAEAVASLTATIDEVNAAYARSGVHLVMESAAIEHVAYVGSTDANIELNRITGTTDGHLDSVHAMRDALGADLVVFVTQLNATLTCGVAWLPTPPVTAGDSAYGFSVAEPSCAGANLTFAHETAHNLGAGHGNGDGGGVTSYANGYRNTVAGYRTIMAYDAIGCCRRIAHFSSPTELYDGQPTGSSTQDNARVLNEFGPLVAGFRGAPGELGSVLPARLFDSRAGEPTVDGRYAGGGRVAGGSVTEVPVLQRGGVPSFASSVVLNVAAVFPGAPGYLTVYPCGQTPPLASNLNFLANAVVPNAVVAKVGLDGKVCVYSSALTDLVIDVNGFVVAGSAVGSLAPARLFDSRPGQATADGHLAGAGRRGAGWVTEVPVFGRGGVPESVSSVVLNVAAVLPSVAGFATVYPCGQALPTASNLNFLAGAVVANAVVAKVGVDGKVCVYTSAPTDLVVDVNGFVSAGSAVASLVPARLFDSRPGESTVDGQFAGRGRRAGGSETAIAVLGRGGVPWSASSVVLNVAAVWPGAAGYITVYPCGQAPPLASNLNFLAGAVVPNAVVAKVGAGGRVCVYTSAATDLVVDVNGYVSL